MIVVIDINAVVSGLLKPFSKPGAILRLVTGGHIRAAFDNRILAEYREVLARPKFPFSTRQVDEIIEQLASDGIPVQTRPLPDALPNPDDEMFVEAALHAKCQALITGNKAHFPEALCSGVTVVSASEFLEFYRKRQ